MDELIRVNRGARNTLLTLEDLTEAELEHLKQAFAKLAESGDADTIRKAKNDIRQAQHGLQEAQSAIARSKTDADA